MPIKFRCIHCGQLLGIARRKSGTDVDCPRCMKSVLVPQTDEPDKGDPPGAPVIPVFESEDFDRLIAKQGEKDSTVGARLAAPPKPAPAKIVEPPPIRKPPTLAAPRSVDATKDKLMYVGAPPVLLGPVGHAMLIVFILLATFMMGLVVGRYVFPAATPHSQNAANKKGENGEKAAKPVRPAEDRPKFLGLVRYREAGDEKGDGHCAVLALPTNVEVNQKISVLGLRPEDRILENRPGLRQLNDYGGAMAFANANGQFEVDVERPGAYTILIISRHARRDMAQQLPKDEKAILNKYFDDVDNLLGDRDFYLQLIPQESKAGETLRLQIPAFLTE